jgi:hypothetical protein
MAVKDELVIKSSGNIVKELILLTVVDPLLYKPIKMIGM